MFLRCPSVSAAVEAKTAATEQLAAPEAQVVKLVTAAPAAGRLRSWRQAPFSLAARARSLRLVPEAE